MELLLILPSIPLSLHPVVQQVVRQVPNARVAVSALDVLVVRPDHDARRRFAHE